MAEITLPENYFKKVLLWTDIILLQMLVAGLYLVLEWQLFFSIAALVAMAAIFILKPEWSLYLLIFCVVIFWNAIGVTFIAHKSSALIDHMNTMPIYLPLVLIGLGCVGIRIAAQIQSPVNSGNPLNIPIFILFIYSLYSITWTANLQYSLFAFAFFSFVILLYYYTYFMDLNEKIYKKCIWCWIFTGIILSVLTIISIIYTPGFCITENLANDFHLIFRYETNMEERGYALMHPNYTSYTLNAPIGLIIGLLILSKSYCQRFLLFFLLILMLFANCLTLSKGGIGSCLIMICCIITGSSELRNKAVYILPVFTIIFVVIRIGAVAFIEIFGNAFHARLFESGGKLMSISGRLENWQHGFDLLQKKGLLLKGLGLGGFQHYTEYLNHAHSLYLAFYFDFGLVGIICGLSILFIIINVLFKNGIFLFFNQSSHYQTMRLVFTSILIAYLIHGLVDFWYSQTFLWFFMGFAMVTFNFANMDDQRWKTTKGAK
jgi:hypothetical protein